jgi:phosphoglucomutase/phosphomannomutase
VEKTISLTMPGATGMQRMQALMRSLRENPPQSLAGIRVTQVRDYERQVILTPGSGQSKLDGPQGDMVMLDLSETGNYVAIRPSGTEPKVKLYMFTFEPPEQIANLEDAERTLSDRLKKIEADLREFAEGV